MKTILPHPFGRELTASASAPDLGEQLRAEDRADRTALVLIVCTALALLVLGLAAALQST